MDMQPIVAIMRQTQGSDISRFDDLFLAKTVARRMAAVEAADHGEYQRRLAQDPQEAKTLLDSLLVSHSEFFRGSLGFAVLEELALPELVRQKRQAGQNEIRVWSAGCAAGQEAYSVAILLDEMALAREVGIGYRVFATDVSESALAAAGRGSYHAVALQHVRLRHLEHYFTRHGDIYTIASRLREGVDFSVHDLLDERTICPPACIFGDFDLIVCCNVMFYYHAELRRRILGKVLRCLRPDGYFLTGEAERELVQNTNGFRVLAPPAPVFERVGTGR